MKYLSTLPRIARRVIATIAVASAAGLIVTTAAFAASSAGSVPGARLAAATARVSSAAAVPACRASQFGVWVGLAQSNGTAGTIYYPLNFTNASRQACSLRGFPGVSALARNGHQLGSPAGWSSGVAARTVTVAPGATAHTILQYGDAEVSAVPGCDPVNTAVTLRVYPPDQHDPTVAAFDLEVCSHPGPVYLRVEPILPGVGMVNG